MISHKWSIYIEHIKMISHKWSIYIEHIKMSDINE